MLYSTQLSGDRGCKKFQIHASKLEVIVFVFIVIFYIIVRLILFLILLVKKDVFESLVKWLPTVRSNIKYL